MSVSIALLPVALALRIVMGEQNFENWVNAQQIKVPTDFASEIELMRTVKKAGYDAIKFGSSVKTHIDGENTFFFWEKIDGQWVAVFSKYDDQNLIKQFMKKVASVTGRTVFDQMPELKQNEIKQFPTNFRDEQLLLGALIEFGAQPVIRKDDSIACKIEKSMLLFRRTGDVPYSVEIQNAPKLEEVYQYLSDLDEDYKRCVQTAVYEKVKARAANYDMTLESEEVLPDKTIVLTLRVS